MEENRLQVSSEIGNLRRVIVHRPDASLKRLTPTTHDLFLFDDMIDADLAALEHDVFTQVLRSQNVNVLYFQDLLATVLDIPEARHALIDQHCESSDLGEVLAHDVQAFLREQTPQLLLQYLLAGISTDEFTKRTDSLTFALQHTPAFILDPLPNHLFTRDASCWINNRVMLNTMATKARAREMLNFKAIYTHHPLFKNSVFQFINTQNGIKPTDTFESGDILIIDEQLLLIGVSERTSASGVEHLARCLFEQSKVCKIIAIELPHERRTMHLDTVLTMMSHNAFSIYAPIIKHARAFLITPGVHEIHIDALKKPLFSVIADHLQTNEIQLVETGGDDYIRDLEQWNDANNVLTIRPGVIVCYERNHHTIEKMHAAGMTVLTIPGNELGKGRGGPRCMSCPIERDNL